MSIDKHPWKGHRLTAAFGIVIVLFLSFGIFTVRGVWRIGALTRTIYEHPLVVSNASLNAALQITKMHRSMRDVVLSQTDKQREAALRAVQRDEQRVFEQLNIVRDKILGEEGALLEKKTRRLFLDWQPIRAEVVNLLRIGNREGAVSLTQTVGANHTEALETEMMSLAAYARNKATLFLASAEAEQLALERLSAVLITAGVILSMLIAWFATRRVARTERMLSDERDKLQDALSEIKTLRGIIPICSYCKQIRDDAGAWKQLEEYIHEHSDAAFSHSICPKCMETHYPDIHRSIQLSSDKSHS